MTISHIGNLSLNISTFSIALNDVLVVPQFTRNLLSLSKLLLDNSLLIEFFFSFCQIKDRQTKTLLIQAPLISGLYIFSLPPSIPPKALLGARVSADLWHARFGHPSSSTTLHLLHAFSLPCSLHKMSLCSECCMAKSHKLPFTSSTSLSHAPLEIVHSDLWGPSPVVSKDGYRYYVIFVDDFTHFTWLYFLRTKDELPKVFALFKQQVENLLNHTIKILRTDGGTEYKPLSRLFPQITYQTTCPYTPQQNGLAERMHRYIVELSLATMTHASIPLPFWDEIFASIVYLINRLPSSSTKSIPFQKLFTTKPDYTFLRVLGCLCFPYLRPYNDHKLQQRSLPCVFIGYAYNQKGYKCLHVPTNRIYISRHVTFDETVFPFSTDVTSSSDTFGHTSPDYTTMGSQPLTLASPLCTPSAQHQHITTSPQQGSATAHNIPAPVTFAPPARQLNLPADRTPLQTIPSDPPAPSSPVTAPTNTPAAAPVTSLHPMTTRTRDNTRRPRTFPDHVALISTAPTETEPTTFRQANQSSIWRAAMSQEIDALAQNQTWTLVPPPTDHNIVGCKWVYRIKRHSDGSIERYKARLVAKGFTQEEGIDFFDTFSPVIRPMTIRLVLSLALSLGWTIKQLDVQNAFLHGTLQETVYMSQPPGFVDPSYPSHVCRLNKALYGLKQSPRAWFHTLTSALIAYGFCASNYDPSLFVYHYAGSTIVVLVYVDDIIVTGDNSLLLSKAIQHLHSHFAIKDLGSLKFFLGIEVTSTSHGFHLTQTKYLKDILSRANMLASKPTASPMVVNTSLSIHDGDPMENPSLYRMIVGALQYATRTRPDIAFAVNKVSQFMHSPSTSHWDAVKRILRYINGTLTHGLTLKPSTNPILHAYSDSDWAGCKDDRRSTSGYAIFLGPNLISWSAKKQTTVSRSSTEAEYRALALASAELVWLQFLLHELHISCPSSPILWCDNIGATFLASNPMFHARTKHVEIDYHFIREKVQSKELEIKFICSKDQIADIMTKPLTTPRFLLLRDKLTVTSVPFACEGAVIIQETMPIGDTVNQDNQDHL
ncbi:Gag/pol [Rhynchospora pubera]|uniref:Gag/pol n=1 Tax=Rhynchospora pubera TaxID=906938 RepID=A0AAV8DT52_9POAL|nr:Gag/pol [Rhynchospora pubera]